MRNLGLLVVLAGCSFQVKGVAVSPDDPGPSPPIMQPFPPASAPTDVPDLAQSPSPDLAQPPAPDLTPPTIVCAAGMECDFTVAAGASVTYDCQADCEVDCREGASCTIACAAGAECDCRGKSCSFSTCAQLTDCKGDRFVCNGDCGDRG
jgi:hypothetical protein